MLFLQSFPQNIFLIFVYSHQVGNSFLVRSQIVERVGLRWISLPVFKQGIRRCRMSLTHLFNSIVCINIQFSSKFQPSQYHKNIDYT